jgi:hypothetical protein
VSKQLEGVKSTSGALKLIQGASPMALAPAILKLAKKARTPDVSPSASDIVAVLAPKYAKRFNGGSANGIAARTTTVDDMGITTRRDVFAATLAAMEGLAQLFVPGDSEYLLKQLASNPQFHKLFSPPTGTDTAPDGSKSAYETWATCYEVIAVKGALEATPCMDPRRIELLSLFYNRPLEWLRKRFGVSHSVAIAATVHAQAVGPGLPDPDCRPLVRNRRTDELKEAFFVEFMGSDTAVTADPTLNQHGKGVVKRVLVRNQLYKLYVNAALDNSTGYYGRTVFFESGLQEGLKDKGTEHGLCPACEKYGHRVWDRAVWVIGILYRRTDDRYDEGKRKICEFKRYFVDRGPFWRAIQESSKCQHHCRTFLQSDPFNPIEFSTTCGDSCEGHRYSDRVCLERDAFFAQLVADADEFLNNKNYIIAPSGGRPQCRAVSITPHGVVHLEACRSNQTFDVMWTESGLSNAQVEELDLPQFIDNLLIDHSYYIKHLLLDRTQLSAENFIIANSEMVILLDYMVRRRELYTCFSRIRFRFDFLIFMNSQLFSPLFFHSSDETQRRCHASGHRDFSSPHDQGNFGPCDGREAEGDGGGGS